MSKTFLSVFVVAGLAAGIAHSQPIGGGIKLGVPLTDAFQSISTETFQGSPQRFVVGPYVEVRLPGQLSVEADALHQTLDFTLAGVSLNSGSWEFPIVVKHKMLAGPIKPYFEGGLSFSRLSDVRALVANHTDNFGIVAGGGVEIHLLALKISPEIRYDGWFLQNFDTTVPSTTAPTTFLGNVLQSRRNQIAFLVGFGF